MALETFSGIWSLNASNPLAADDLAQGDEHFRGIKAAILNTFPNLSATANVRASELNHLSGVASNVANDLGSLSKSLVALAYYGSIYLKGSSTEFSATTSMSLFTGFATPGVVSGMAAGTATGALETNLAGHFAVDASLSISASAANVVTAAIYVTDTESDIQAQGEMAAGNTLNLFLTGIVSAGASDLIKIRLKSTATTLLTVTDAQLRARKLN